MQSFGLKPWGLALAALSAITMISGAARAAEKPPVVAAATADQVADAKLLASAAGLTCPVGEVRFIGAGEVKDKDKKSVKVSVYEIACGERWGYVLQGPKGGVSDTIATPCIALEGNDPKDPKKPNPYRCTLPANQNTLATIQAAFTAAGGSCTVQTAKWRGVSKTQHDLFEVACPPESPGFILNAPRAAEPATLSTCLKLAGATCELTTPAQQTAWIASLASKSGKACSVTKARWVGTSSTNNDFYEVGCATGPGFMFETNAAGAFDHVIPCAAAANLNGGCTLTDAAVVQASGAQEFKERLKAAGIACDLQKSRVIGQDTRYHRDVIEFTCADQPYGLVAALPTPGGQGKVEHVDCFSAARLGVKCELTARDILLSTLTKAMAGGTKTCAVSDFGYAGFVDDATIDLEVACSGQPGYVIEIPTTYAKPKVTETCAQSAKDGLVCKLPGNT